MVRSADGSAKMLAATLQDLMNDVARNAKHASIRVFRREKLDSDICIVLFRIGTKKKTGKSPLGLRLAAALKEAGMVHHTVWGEIER